MKKGITLIKTLAIVGMIALVGLTVFGSTQKTYACGWLISCAPETDSTNTFTKEAATTEVNQRMLVKNNPIPTFETSQERINLTKRLTTFNKADKISYIYLLSFGKVMTFYTVKGKVSSVNSMLTNTEQLVDRWGNQCSSNSSTDCWSVPSPDLDGSYGSNGNAIFFFTTEGAYVEWNGEYMLADQPLKMATQPELIREIK